MRTLQTARNRHEAVARRGRPRQGPVELGSAGPGRARQGRQWRIHYGREGLVCPYPALTAPLPKPSIR